MNSQQLILYFALGNNISLRTILGTPSLIAIHRILDMFDSTLTLRKLDMKLPLVMTKPYPGLTAPSDSALQSFLPAPSNQDSVALYTLSNSSNTKFLTHPSRLNNLVVTDSWENNTFSRSVSSNNNSVIL